ncbi:grasp-with-spasm system ATP-grasp peptide maturase [Fluviicola chungangensis]|uniref:Grasp-with-spasm system ATP-grasp peptide maturase n=1 Tax=Fluviicola chungangensis TaxID=2597671 RepID=A0A556MN85_9FLAO|nr:grasp-with-spasm system ATP-grasp peptide maturase [Fluviicola chungangensis]TSJ41288.1 grasp-with-spasm system ATP-grasp peptide maturase [Fluviicola chungangensis]
MILILTDKEEPTSDLIIGWLLRMQKPFYRISVADVLEFNKVYMNPETKTIEIIFSFVRNGETITIDTKDITSYWYRRSILSKKFKEINYGPYHEEVSDILNGYKKEEHLELIKYLNYVLDKKAKLNSDIDNEVIKFQSLDLALKVGLEIPSTLVTTKKSDLLEFVKAGNDKIITKPIGNPFSFVNHGMYQFTSLVELDRVPEQFELSQVQKAIDKKFELRIFYFNLKFYSSAVMSQANEKTKIDVKNYDDNNPNRIVPYLLPAEIENKLRRLMNLLNLKSGSIDMIVDKNDKFIFLEVNPIGQFEQVANPCNYDLYYLIADHL